MLKYGRLEDVNVGGTGNASVTINDICADLGTAFTDTSKTGRIHVVQPSLVKSKSNFDFTANVKLPLNGLFRITATTQSNMSVGPKDAVGITTVTAPESYVATDNSIAYSLQFFISADMLKKGMPGEVYTKWVRTDNSLNSTFAPLVQIGM